MTEEEIRKRSRDFRRIEDHPNYAINPFGIVYNLKKNTRLKPVKDDRGYLRVRLDGKREMISRLVAKIFIPNPYNKPNVRYKDGNRSNVCSENLQWATNSEIKRPDRHK